MPPSTSSTQSCSQGMPRNPGEQIIVRWNEDVQSTSQKTAGVVITGLPSQAFRAQVISTGSHVQLDRSTAQTASLHILAV